VFLDRSNCQLMWLRLVVGILAAATLLMHLRLLLGQARSRSGEEYLTCSRLIMRHLYDLRSMSACGNW
jgi:hypothetical protein